MIDNFNSSLSLVLVHEGGFSDHPQDPGGATMKGVTLETFQRFFGADQTVAALKNITQEQLSLVYRSGYWNKCKGDQLPAGLDYSVFDAAVNSGPGSAGRFLQAALGIPQDGAIGQNTLAAIANTQAPTLITGVCDQRLAFLQKLNTFSTFGKGWSKRVDDVREQALKMANGSFSGQTASVVLPATPSMDFVTIKLGSTGPWVSRLQDALGVNADGQFGPATEAAVRALQAERGLVVDGIAGRSTCRALGLLA